MHDARRRPLWSWLLALCAAFALAPLDAETAFAEEEKEEASEGEEAADDGLMEPSADQAKKLGDALKKASKKKKAPDITPALDAIDDFKHPSFEKPLLKLMNHKLGNIAVRATQMLRVRANEKLVKKMWKNAFSNKANAKRYAVRAEVVLTVGALGKTLDKNQYKELERDWRWMFGNPQVHFAEPAGALIDYFTKSKDKRHCRKLAEQLDEPMATNPNSPSNPPAEWWERRWKMWKPLKPRIVEALKSITGQEFDKTEEAKAWFEKNKKTFKFDW